jgi:hypothetical protein
MKNIIFLLITFLMISCTTKKLLKTDTQQDIDLSGRWNNTDAEIASSELFSTLVSSVWLKEYQAKHSLKPRIVILEFGANFKTGGEKIENYFTQYIEGDSSFELVVDRSEKVPEIILTGEIIAEEYITETENYIDYTLKAQLKNMEEEVQWEGKTKLKKYIKD